MTSSTLAISECDIDDLSPALATKSKEPKRMFLKWSCIRLLWKAGVTLCMLTLVMLVRAGDYLLRIEVPPMASVSGRSSNQQAYKLFTEQTSSLTLAPEHYQMCMRRVGDRLLNSSMFWRVIEEEEELRSSSTSSWSVPRCSFYQDVAKLDMAVEVDILRNSRASENLPNDITLATQLSHDRIDKLLHILHAWPGPISAAVYLDVDAVSDFISILCNSTELRGRKNLQLHVMRDIKMLYPVNKLRNLALEHVDTRFVFLSDVDFIPQRQLYSQLSQKANNNLLDPKKAYVIPAFEVTEAGPLNVIVDQLPRDKHQLRQLWDEDKVRQFHVNSAASGHARTNYELWKEADTPYQINFTVGYEPYVVMETKSTPKYDPSFLARYYNKATHLAEIFASGVEFWVLPDTFTIHVPHGRNGWKGFIIKKWCARQAFDEFHDRIKLTYNVSLW